MFDNFINYMIPVVGTALGTLLSALFAYLIVYINKKKQALLESSKSEIEKKYIEKISKTITDCVIATNQTFVETLKKENAFTKEAQEEAFQKTITNVMSILNEDCIEYLESITSDITVYLRNKIEAEVNKNKIEKPKE